jgi:hypothetical protein
MPSTFKIKTVRGRGLAIRKLGKAQRAVLGAEILEGTVTLTDLSAKQVAAAVGVSTTYLNAALRASTLHREAVQRGLRPLAESHVKASAERRLAKIVAEIGVDRVLTTLAAQERGAG